MCRGSRKGNILYFTMKEPLRWDNATWWPPDDSYSASRPHTHSLITVAEQRGEPVPPVLCTGEQSDASGRSQSSTIRWLPVCLSVCSRQVYLRGVTFRPTDGDIGLIPELFHNALLLNRSRRKRLHRTSVMRLCLSRNRSRMTRN